MIASPKLIDLDSNPQGISDGYWQDTTGPEEGEWHCVGFDMCNDEFQTKVLAKNDVTHFLIPEGPWDETERNILYDKLYFDDTVGAEGSSPSEDPE